jgi:ABC-type lipoprotein export system ATPase subunit
VKPGTVTIVRGRSGAGKSTLLRMMLGLSDPDAGEALLAGHVLLPLGRAERADLRRRTVGVSSQSGALAESLDTWENLNLARAARGLPSDRPAVAAVVAGLGLDAVADRSVRLLSGGERQRVAIARSLVVQRPLVVLDEPTSQQDEAHAERVTAVLVAAARAGAAIVCATHDPVLAAAADDLIELA